MQASSNAGGGLWQKLLRGRDSAPKLSHVSSIILSLYFFAILTNFDILVEVPSTCTNIIAFVRLFILFIILAVSILKLFNSTSTNIGFRLF